LTTNDVKVVSVPGVEAGVRAIIEGRADATGSAGLGMATNNELEADKGARYLSFDPSPEALKRMQEYYPCYIVQVSPGPGRVGIKDHLPACTAHRVAGPSCGFDPVGKNRERRYG
jgi:hypothetical protein